MRGEPRELHRVFKALFPIGEYGLTVQFLARPDQGVEIVWGKFLRRPSPGVMSGAFSMASRCIWKMLGVLIGTTGVIPYMRFLWRGLQSFETDLQYLLVVIAVVQQTGQIVTGFRIVAAMGDCRSVRFRRSCFIVFQPVGITEIVLRRREVRTSPDGFLKLRDGTFDISSRRNTAPRLL